MNETEQLRVCYENILRHNPQNIEAVEYLATWHLHRNSYYQGKKYFAHLVTLKQNCDVFLSLSMCGAMSEEFDECLSALHQAAQYKVSKQDDIRILFCKTLLSEKKREFQIALDGYVNCLSEITNLYEVGWLADISSMDASRRQMNDIRGEIQIRMVLIRKEMGHMEQAMALCSSIPLENFGDSIRANALCLKGLLHEMRAEYPASEVVYRSALQILPRHGAALERLGRVYLRYRETIPAAVQCFFKSVETNPSNHVAWYLLGRCYMATAQYTDACEAYNRAINLNPNDPQVWCSLGVLYYAFGQYRESLGMLARALKLEPSMADAWYNVGALYDMVDQPDDAQQAYMKARENGLADRFARAGMGLNPLAMQSTSSNQRQVSRHGSVISVPHQADTNVSISGSRLSFDQLSRSIQGNPDE